MRPSDAAPRLQGLDAPAGSILRPLMPRPGGPSNRASSRKSLKSTGPGVIPQMSLGNVSLGKIKAVASFVGGGRVAQQMSACQLPKVGGIRASASMAVYAKGRAGFFGVGESKVFTVKLKSNWGSEDRIRVGTIAFLDEERRAIEVQNVASIPKLPGVRFDRLIDGRLVKTSDECWSVTWPPPGGYDELTLVFCIDPERNPRFLRVWNANSGDNAGVKDIEVTEAKDDVGFGEIPQDFGADLPLNQRVASLLGAEQMTMCELFPALVEKRLMDKYGSYPMKKVRELRLEVLSNWGDPSGIALNAMDVFNEEGQVMGWEQIDDIMLGGCIPGTPVVHLLREDKRSVAGDEQWIARTNWQVKPTLLLKFKEPVYVSRVKVYNFNALDMNLGMGVRNARVYVNGNFFWAGKLGQSNGHINELELRATSIWLLDMQDIRKRVTLFDR